MKKEIAAVLLLVSLLSCEESNISKKDSFNDSSPPVSLSEKEIVSLSLLNNDFSVPIEEVERQALELIEVISSQKSISYEYQNFYHNNFGWGSASWDPGWDNNGWYKVGVFDTSGDYSPDLPSGSRTAEGTPGNYQYQLKIMSGIKPNLQ
jgi:hypothetical protein